MSMTVCSIPEELLYLYIPFPFYPGEVERNGLYHFSFLFGSESIFRIFRNPACLNGCLTNESPVKRICKGYVLLVLLCLPSGSVSLAAHSVMGMLVATYWPALYLLLLFLVSRGKHIVSVVTNPHICKMVTFTAENRHFNCMLMLCIFIPCTIYISL